MINTSIIIRTKNEERWINNCLSMVFSQTHKNFEVIVVDNNSSDNTLKIVKNFPVKKIIKIKKFYPGLALDKGIRVSKGRFLVFLSSHCIPTDKNWLKNLLKNFKNKKIVGVYGKQLPLPFTDSQDKRDLLLTFGKDRKIQKKDYFFHNANSAILKSMYIKFPFDLRVKNMEDRIWAKQVIDSNYNLCYEPKAGVYHYHGLHHKNNFNRLKGVSTIINSVDKEELNYLPDFMKPKNLKLITVIPLLKRKKLSIKEIDHINKLLKTLLSSEFINNVYFITRSTHKFLKDKRIKIIKTSKKVVTHNLDELLKFSLNEILSYSKPNYVYTNKFQLFDTNIDLKDIYKYFLTLIIFVSSFFLLTTLLTISEINFEDSFKIGILTLMNTTTSSMYGLNDFNFYDLNSYTKFILIIFMTIGRFELISLLIIIKKFFIK